MSLILPHTPRAEAKCRNSPVVSLVSWLVSGKPCCEVPSKMNGKVPRVSVLNSPDALEVFGFEFGTTGCGGFSSVMPPKMIVSSQASSSIPSGISEAFLEMQSPAINEDAGLC